jgi:hypothetical protein
VNSLVLLKLKLRVITLDFNNENSNPTMRKSVLSRYFAFHYLQRDPSSPYSEECFQGPRPLIGEVKENLMGFIEERW